MMAAQEELKWYHPNFPPANFVDGLMEGLGYHDQTEKFIAQALPQFQHSYTTAGYQRIIHSLKFDKGCIIGLHKSEQRRDKLTFSVPYLLTFPNGLVFKESDRKKFTPYVDDEGSISIKQLLDDESLIAGMASGRKYQGAIDIELDKHRHKDNIVARSNNDVFAGLLQMLDKNRIDYLFGFPEELEYHTSLGVLDHKMSFLPISEMPKFLTSYVACSKNAWGQKVIDEIDGLLLKNRADAKFLRFYEFWLDFESKKRHQKYSLNAFSTKTKAQ